MLRVVPEDKSIITSCFRVEAQRLTNKIKALGFRVLLCPLKPKRIQAAACQESMNGEFPRPMVSGGSLLSKERSFQCGASQAPGL